MNNEIKVMNNDEIRDFCIKKDLKIFELEQELRQKENIIKEAREYVYKTFNIEPANSREYDYHCGKLAEILDKENKE